MRHVDMPGCSQCLLLDEQQQAAKATTEGCEGARHWMQVSGQSGQVATMHVARHCTREATLANVQDSRVCCSPPVDSSLVS